MQNEFLYPKNTLSLKDFFRVKKAESESKGKNIDWESRKQIWLTSIDKLYNDINCWLAPSIEESLIELKYEKTVLSEDYVNAYSVNNILIQVGFERVFLKPKGMIIMGALGRVDMIGEHGTVWLLLLNEPTELDFKWYLAVRTVRQKYWPLTEDSFADALKQVMQA
jgi:hypothetical protein